MIKHMYLCAKKVEEKKSNPTDKDDFRMFQSLNVCLISLLKIIFRCLKCGLFQTFCNFEMLTWGSIGNPKMLNIVRSVYVDFLCMVVRVQFGVSALQN